MQRINGGTQRKNGSCVVRRRSRRGDARKGTAKFWSIRVRRSLARTGAAGSSWSGAHSRSGKSKPLRVHPASANILREIKRYSWKQDKDGNITDEVVKFDDHTLDAGRYASFHFNQPKARFFSQ